MTGKKQIWKILNDSIKRLDKASTELIYAMDTETPEYISLETLLFNIRNQLSFLEISLHSEIKQTNEKSKFEKAWKRASDKVSKLELNFLNQDFKYNKLKRKLNKQNKW